MKPLDIILPLTFDLTQNYNVILSPRNQKEYFDNYECSLMLTFLPDNVVRIDYYCDDDSYLFEDKLYEENLYNLSALTKVQYSLAKFLNIKTTDIKEDKSITIDIEIPLIFHVGMRNYYLTLMFGDDNVSFDYLCYDRFSNQNESLFNLFEYDEMNTTFEKDKLKKLQKDIQNILNEIGNFATFSI